jgi:hypothetical protein
VPQADKQSCWRLASVLLLALDLMLLAWLGLWEIPSIDMYKDIYAGMNAKVPTLGMLVLSIPQIAWYSASAAVLLGILAKEFLPNKKMTTTLNGVAALVILLVMMLIHAALRLPLMSLMNPLQAW